MMTTPKKVELPIAVKQVTKLVKVPLATEDQRQLGQAMASMMVDVEFLRDELKQAIHAQRSHIDDLKATIRKHAKTLCAGYADQLADVALHYDFNTDTVRTMYQGKCLEDRPMTEAEKQLDLDLCLQQGMTLTVQKDGGTVKAV